MQRFKRKEQLRRLSSICLANGKALLDSIKYCADNHIGCFRVNSRILPLKTHPFIGYNLSVLPDSIRIKNIFSECRKNMRKHKIRLTFHPDQFVVLNSPVKDVVCRSVEELIYQAEISRLIGADVINIHAGGGYNDKVSALKRLGQAILKLSKNIKSRLAIENDDRIFTPSDLIPFCRDFCVPFIYDIHHHRCNPDKLSTRQAAAQAVKTWDREPVFHVSSPKNGWNGPHIRRHSDYIDINDFPREWKRLNITVEVEAKAKELAVSALMGQVLCL